jgi:hypothetical protein
MPGHLSNVTPFASDLMTNTDWANPSDNIIGALFPNFFIVYFGQNILQGGISSNNIKVKFAKLGTCRRPIILRTVQDFFGRAQQGQMLYV